MKTFYGVLAKLVSRRQFVNVVNTAVNYFYMVLCVHEWNDYQELFFLTCEEHFFHSECFVVDIFR